MDSEKFKNWALGGGTIGIVIALLLATFGYLAPIKSDTELLPLISDGIARIDENIEFLPSISEGIARIDENTELLPSISEGIASLKERTRALILPREGGRLRTWDWHTIIDVQPKVVLKEILMEYAPVATKNLPAELPEGIKPLKYNFALTPYSLAGSQLPNFSLKPPAEISIAYAHPSLGLTTIKPTDLILLRWDEKEGKWTPIKTTVEGNLLRAPLAKFGLLTLASLVSEVPEKS